jgi:hypothetical protein
MGGRTPKKVEKFEIAKLELRPGDILLVKTESKLSGVGTERMVSMFKQAIPEDVKVIVTEELDMAVISPVQMNPLIEITVDGYKKFFLSKQMIREVRERPGYFTEISLTDGLLITCKETAEQVARKCLEDGSQSQPQKN